MWQGAIKKEPGLASGINVMGGYIRNKAVAQAHELPFKELWEVQESEFRSQNGISLTVAFLLQLLTPDSFHKRTTFALRILGLVRIDSMIVSSGTESRFKTVRTSPPRWSLLKDMFAMFTACAPRTVPIWPTIPGTSWFSKRSRTPTDRASTWRPLIRTILGDDPIKVPATETVSPWPTA